MHSLGQVLLRTCFNFLAVFKALLEPPRPREALSLH